MRQRHGYVIDDLGNRLALYFDEPFGLMCDSYERDAFRETYSCPPPDADYMLENGTRLDMRIDNGRVSYHDCDGRAYTPERAPGQPS